jgi:hypothetical protein
MASAQPIFVGLLEPDAWKSCLSGSEGAAAQQCAVATRPLKAFGMLTPCATCSTARTRWSGRTVADVPERVDPLRDLERQGAQPAGPPRCAPGSLWPKGHVIVFRSQLGCRALILSRRS